MLKKWIWILIFWQIGTVVNAQDITQKDSLSQGLENSRKSSESEVDYSFKIWDDTLGFNGKGFNNELLRFNHATFSENVSFKNCTIEGMLNFSDSRFKKTLNISSSTLFTPPLFDKIRLFGKLVLKDLDLAGVSNKIAIDLSKIHPVGECEIDLQNTDISRVKLDYVYFKLVFSESKPFQNEWSRKMWRRRVYLGLLKQQKRDNFKEGYKKLYKEFAALYSNERGLLELLKPDPLETKTISVDISNENEDIETVDTEDVQEKPSNFWEYVGVFMVMILGIFIALVLYFQPNNSTSAFRQKTTSPSVATNNQTNPKKQPTPSLNKIKIKEVNKNVTRGKSLWKTYQVPAEGEAEPEQFWTRYEQLLQKVKKHN